MKRCGAAESPAAVLVLLPLLSSIRCVGLTEAVCAAWGGNEATSVEERPVWRSSGTGGGADLVETTGADADEAGTEEAEELITMWWWTGTGEE